MTSPTNRSPCPRCGAPVKGDFKFCPTCAYRLQPTTDWEAEPTPRRGRWSYAILLLFLGSLFTAILVIGFRLFAEPPSRIVPDAGLRPELRGPLTVARLKDRMIHLPRATAVYSESPDGAEDWAVQVGDCLFCEVETTRGEWLEFVEACRADPQQVPDFLQNLWRPTVAKEPEEDTEDQHVARVYANQYIDAWWERVQAHHAEAYGEDVERPLDLVAPLPESYGPLLLVPPTWVRLGTFEEFTWALPEGTARLPVTDVSFYDAVAFANWASNVLGIGLRLPTAMEWMRAGNGGDPERRYPWGNEGPLGERLPRFACNSTSLLGPADTPQLLRVDFLFADGGNTPEGVLQMSGNAREWLHNHALNPRDRYYGTTRTEERTYTRTTEEGTEEEVRVVLADAPTIGGSFREAIEDCTVDLASRRFRSKFGRWNDVGFRLWARSDWMGK